MRITCLLTLLQFFFGLTSYSQQTDNYSAEVDINTKQGVARGKLAIHWKAPVDIDTIPFVFQYKSGLDKVIKKISVNNTPASFVESAIEANAFYLLLPEKIKKNDIASIKIDFETDALIDQDGYGYLQAINNWMPTIPSYRNSKFWWGDKDLKKFNVIISFPQEYIAATTGVVKKEEFKNGKRILYTEADDVIQYGICLSDKFLKEETDADGTKIISYYFANDEKWGKKLLSMAKDVILFYKKEIGFYPSLQMSILPGWNRPVGGFPISANMFVIHRNLDQKGENFANWITAHELGHFYWGSGYVLSDNAYPGWFGLSMGIYTDWLYSNYKKLDLSVYNFHYRYMAGYLAGYNTTILQRTGDLEKAGFDYNNVIAHGKSFSVLQMLVQVVGEKTFLKIFKHFLNNYKGKTVDYAEFKGVCQQFSGQDLEWFFKQWYETNDTLDYRISNVRSSISKDDKLNVLCTISRYGKAIMPLEVELVSNNKHDKKTLPGNFKDTVVEFQSYKGAPFELVLDPDNKLLLLERYENDSSTMLFAVNFIINSKKDYGRATSFLDKMIKAEPANPYYLFLYGTLLRNEGKYKSAIETFEKCSSLINQSSYPDRSLLELGKTYDLLGMREKALLYYNQCLSKPSVSANAKQSIQIPFK